MTTLAVLLSERGVEVVLMDEPIPVYRRRVPVISPPEWKGGDINRRTRPRFVYRSYERLTTYPWTCTVWFYEEIWY